jgi:hypothetical protein
MSNLSLQFSCDSSFFESVTRLKFFVAIFEQMVLLSPLSQNSKEFQTEENNARDRRRNIIIQGIDVDFTWVLILFDRGFNHKNLHVRRLVLQSFLELDWANAFEIHACVSEEFMLGSLLTALDDPTHHRDFGKFPTFPI